MTMPTSTWWDRVSVKLGKLQWAKYLDCCSTDLFLVAVSPVRLNLT